MKKMFIVALFMMLILGFSALAYASLNDFINNVNIQAREDMGRFAVNLSAQFGVPIPQVQGIIKQVSMPADAFMVLQLGQMSHKQPDIVLQTYRTSKGKGWGAMAKELGIKPGSPEFHALKRGDLYFTGQPTENVKHYGKGKGKGNGHNKD